MQITNTINSTNNFSFGAKRTEYTDYADLNNDGKLADSSIKLVKKLDNYIEDLWKERKKGNIDESDMIFALRGKRGEVAIIKPIYGANTPLVMLKIDNDNQSEIFLFDRKKPNNFRYEKNVVTDYGSATLKTYNSLRDDNQKIEELANEKIHEYIPRVFPNYINWPKDY